MERIIGTAGWCTSAIHTIAARLRKAMRMRDSMVHAHVLRAWRQRSVWAVAPGDD